MLFANYDVRRTIGAGGPAPHFFSRYTTPSLTPHLSTFQASVSPPPLKKSLCPVSPLFIRYTTLSLPPSLIQLASPLYFKNHSARLPTFLQLFTTPPFPHPTYQVFRPSVSPPIQKSLQKSLPPLFSRYTTPSLSLTYPVFRPSAALPPPPQFKNHSYRPGMTEVPLKQAEQTKEVRTRHFITSRNHTLDNNHSQIIYI